MGDSIARSLRQTAGNTSLQFSLSATSLLRESNGFPSCRTQNWAHLTYYLDPPPPLPEGLCCSITRPAAVFSVATTSGATPLAPLPPLVSNPPTFGCMNKWVSWVPWYVLQRGFSLVIAVWLVANERAGGKGASHAAVMLTSLSDFYFITYKALFLTWETSVTFWPSTGSCFPSLWTLIFPVFGIASARYPHDFLPKLI